MPSPFFSVLIPTYNQANYVGHALDSLLAQTDPDWEAVVVNDGSTDETTKVLEHYSHRDQRIRVLHKPNGGTGSALNAALSMTRGQWVCWLSSDDLFDPGKLAVHRQWIGNEPSCHFFFTHCRMLSEQTGITTDHGLCGPLPEQEFQILGLFYRNFVSGISICVNRKAWESVGQFNENLRYGQDYDMWLRLLSRCPAKFIPVWTCTSRVHSRQGSAEFERACYYDSASAAIEFLNEHRFEDLFPLLDLRDTATALRAMEQALDRAADESGFLYWFGAHPALLLRALAWAWDRSLGVSQFKERAPVREAARQILSDGARKLRGSPLGWHWHVASAAADLEDCDFVYTPVHPVDVGRGFIHDLRVRKSPELAEAERYLKFRYALQLPTTPEHLGRRTVIVCAKHDGASNSHPTAELPVEVSEWATALEQSGCNVVALRDGHGRCCQVRNLLVIETRTLKTQNAVLRSLMPVEAVIWLDVPSTPILDLPARHHHVATESTEDASIVAQRIAAGVSNVRLLHCPTISRQPLDRKKVAFVGYGCIPAIGGGAPRVIYDLLSRLDPQKFDLHFVDLNQKNEPSLQFDSNVRVHRVIHKAMGITPRLPIWKRALRRGIRIASSLINANVIRPDYEALFDSIRQQWPNVVGLREVFHDIGADALLVPVLEENVVRVWLAQAYCRQRFCASLHTVESPYLSTIYPDPDRLTMERFLFTSACRDAAMVTVPSQGCKDDLTANLAIPASNIEVASNPIDMRAIIQATLDPLEIPLPALQGKCLFVHAARLCRLKNHRLLLEACRVLKQTHPDFLVVCLGDGDMRRSIQEDIQEMDLANHVVLLGAVKNPFAYMARAQGVLLTSHFESFALVLVEALACGAVPVSVDCQVGPREVLENGKYGLLVPNNDPQSYANAMHRVMVDRQLRAAARTHGPMHAYKYDVSKVVPQWEERLERIMAQPVCLQRQAA